MTDRRDSATILMSGPCQTDGRWLRPTEPVRSRFAARAGVVLLLALGIPAFFLFDPSKTWFFPRCPFFVLTGLRCPGCGTLRALHAALHCHFAGALHFNPALPVLFILLVCCLIVPRRALRPAFTWPVLVIVVIWGVARNILGM